MNVIAFSSVSVLFGVVRLLQEATQNDQRTRRLEVCRLNTKDLAALDRAVTEGKFGRFRIEFDADCVYSA